MNKVTDIKLGTQLSTVFAMISMYIAHLIGNGTILNDNWNFMIYICLIISTVFMVFPYLFHDDTVTIGDTECIQLTNKHQ